MGQNVQKVKIKQAFLTYLVEWGRRQDLMHLGFHGTAQQGSQCPEGDKGGVCIQ